MKKVGGALFVVAMVFGVYFFASPYLAINGLKSAVQAGDKEKMEEYIDFVVLRQDLKEQFKVVVMKKAESEFKDNPFASLATAFVSTMVDGLVDSFVTPSALSRIMRGNVKQGDASDAGSTENKGEPLSNAEFGFAGMSKFRITVTGKDDNKVIMYMYRDGLSWRLSKMELPLDDL